MAQGKDNIKRSIEDFEKEVTCGVCQEQYTEPKVLPCGHYYCRKCIVKISLRVGTGEPFSCPECRVDITLPEGNVDSLKTAFSVNRLKDTYTSLLKALEVDHSGATAVPELSEPSSSPALKCKVHGDVLVMYCAQCRQLICRDCALNEHSQHNFGYNSTAGPLVKKSVLENLEPLREVEEMFHRVIMKVNAVELEVEAHGDSVSSYIESHFEKLHNTLDDYKKKVLEDSKLDVARRLTDLEAQRVNLSEANADIHSMVEDTEKWSNVSNNEAIGNFWELAERLDNGLSKYQLYVMLNHHSDVYQLFPSINKVGEMKLQTAAQFKDHIQNVAHLIEIPISSNDFTIVKLKQEVPMKSTNSFEIRSKHQDRMIESYISQVQDSSTINCDVCRTGSCTYLVTYTAPDVPGDYQLHVMIDGTDVHNSPFTLTVKDTRSLAKKWLNIS